MKRSFTKALSLLLCAIMLTELVPMTANAASPMTYYSGNSKYTYTVENGEATLTDFFTSDTNTVLLSSIKGYPLTKIGDSAFSYTSGVKYIEIPDTITSIGKQLFQGCETVEGVTIYAPVTSIGDYTFRYCSKLKEVTLPSTVESIGKYAFSGCTKLEAITLPKNIKTFDKGVFNDSGLKSFTFPASTTAIGESMFYNCKNLESITIPSKVTSIESSAFYGTALKNVTIPASVTKIGEMAFANCKSLEQIKISGTVTSFSSNAFDNCTALAKIELPDTAMQLDAGLFSETAFYNNSANWENDMLYIGKHFIATKISSKHVIIKDGTKTIAGNSLRRPSSVTIPTSVTLIGNSAITSSSNISAVYYTGTEQQWKKIEIGSNNSISDSKLYFDALLSKNAKNVSVDGKIITATKGAKAEALLADIVVNVTLKGTDGKAVASDKVLGTGMKLTTSDNRTFTVCVMGDIDGDGDIKATDARLALRASVNLESLSDAQKKAADKNGDGSIKATDARILLRLSVGLPETEPTNPNPTPSEPEKPALTISAEQYKYLAGNDFRSVRRDYSSAVANGAYVVAYVDSNGDQCILTYVSYKIISNYSVTTLHNITKGTTIENPSDYYKKLAERAYGATKIAYMELSSDAAGAELQAMKGLTDSLKTGSSTVAGVYVPASTLNL